WGSVVVLGPILISLAALTWFVLNELTVRHRPPLVEFSLFRDLRFAGASVIAFVGNWTFGVVLFFLTLYLQHVLDLGPLTAGMEAMPDEKAVIASGVLQTARLMGIVIGLALSGSLFNSFENRELLSQVRATGATTAEASDVRGLLSGSDAAEQHVRRLTGAS